MIESYSGHFSKRNIWHPMTSFETIINSLEEAIILFNKAYRATYLNRAAEELFGRSAREL
ncbi:MAG: PAS domain-containing protein, partial [Nitrospirae bacterium]